MIEPNSSAVRSLISVLRSGGSRGNPSLWSPETNAMIKMDTVESSETRMSNWNDSHLLVTLYYATVNITLSYTREANLNDIRYCDYSNIPSTMIGSGSDGEHYSNGHYLLYLSTDGFSESRLANVISVVYCRPYCADWSCGDVFHDDVVVVVVVSWYYC